MKRFKKHAYWAVIPLLVVNVWFLSRRSERRAAEGRLAAKIAQREALESKWLSQPGTRVLTARLDSALREIPAEDCKLPPTAGKREALDQLTGRQKDDLYAAISGLAKAYAANDPNAMISYMSDRRQTIRHGQAEFMRGTLATAVGLPKAELDRKTDEQIYSQFWRESKAFPHWDSIVSDFSCIQTWRSTSAAAKVLDDLAQDDVDLWQRRDSSTLNFTSDRGLDAELREQGSVLMADAKIIVRHDAELLGAASPYYFRFWYDSTSGRWIPLAMVRIRTFEQAPIALLF